MQCGYSVLFISPTASVPFVLEPYIARKKFSQTNFPLLDLSGKIEETPAWYTPDRFYPVEIREAFHSRYTVQGKLGFRGHSTVWVCQDLLPELVLEI